MAFKLAQIRRLTITLKQQNGKVIALVWDDTYTDVDMDMFLWNTGEDPDEFLDFSVTSSD